MNTFRGRGSRVRDRGWCAARTAIDCRRPVAPGSTRAPRDGCPVHGTPDGRGRTTSRCRQSASRRSAPAPHPDTWPVRGRPWTIGARGCSFCRVRRPPLAAGCRPSWAGGDEVGGLFTPGLAEAEVVVGADRDAVCPCGIPVLVEAGIDVRSALGGLDVREGHLAGRGDTGPVDPPLVVRHVETEHGIAGWRSGWIHARPGARRPRHHRGDGGAGGDRDSQAPGDPDQDPLARCGAGLPPSRCPPGCAPTRRRGRRHGHAMSPEAGARSPEPGNTRSACARVRSNVPAMTAFRTARVSSVGARSRDS